MLDFYWDRTFRMERNAGAALHDPCTIAWLLKPDLFEGKQCALQIDCNPGPNYGRTVADWWGTTSDPANVLLVTEADADGFFDLLVERLARLPG